MGKSKILKYSPNGFYRATLYLRDILHFCEGVTECMDKATWPISSAKEVTDLQTAGGWR